jgi:fructosamine-3-kinase
MQLSNATLSEIKHHLQLEEDLLFGNYQRLGGGDINSAARFSLGDEHFFIKWNDANHCPGMFEAEAKGLNELRKADCIRIPEVKFIGEEDGQSFLILELIEQGMRHSNFSEDFGKQLAVMHQVSNDYFGLDHSNYIGSLPQVNTPTSSWTEFFIVYRLEAQLRLARDNHEADTALVNAFNHLFGKLESLFPKEAPALLHGDLWGGNQMPDDQGKPCIYDPAVYYGHREMDLAMTKLFGGFDSKFYESYQAHFPLTEEWNERVDLCNLYPLLVHVNLFGGGYVNQVRGILRYFV